MHHHNDSVYVIHVMVFMFCTLPYPASTDTLKTSQKRLILDITDINITEKEKHLPHHKKRMIPEGVGVY